MPQKHRMAETRDILATKAVHLRSSLHEEKQLMFMTPEDKIKKLEELRNKHAQN